jgi:hypothetical protein
MPLLSRMMRTAAITGRTYPTDAWAAGRQGGRWAAQTVNAAFPSTTRVERTGAAARDPAETLRDLTDLHRRGLLSDAEFDALRGRLASSPAEPSARRP